MNKTIIHAEPESLKNYLLSIWRHRALIVTLAKRDLKVKYAQTILGLAWTIIQPLTAVVVFTIFFTGILNVSTTYPYILFVLSGMLLWGFFQYIFSQGSSALMQNTDLIKKMAFPKIILPISKVLLAFVEFGIGFLLLLGVMVFYQVPLKLTMLLLPFLFLPLILFSLGLGLTLSSLSLQKRDLFHIVPFLVNFGIWLTPVFYPVSLLPSRFENLIYINPVASAIQLFRWSFFNEPLNPFIFIGVSLSFLIFIIGFFSFKKIEDKIIDVI